MNPTVADPTTAADPMSDFASFAQNYNGPRLFGNDTIQPTSQPTTSAPTGGGGFLGWLKRNAQNIGAVAVPTIADIVTGGAAIPFDPLLAGLGGAGGQEVKNATTGTKTNPLEEGAISGALFGAGGLFAKGAGTVASKVSNVADRYGVNLLSQVGGTVDRRTARALDAAGTTRFMSDLGVNPHDYQTVASKITGSNGLLTKLVNEGVSKADNVQTDGLNEMVDNLINSHTGIQGLATDKGSQGFKLSQSLKSQLNKLRGIEGTNAPPLTLRPSEIGPTNVIDAGANPSDTLDLIKSLRSEAAQLTGKGKNPLTITDAARAEANIKTNLSNELEDRLFQGAGADNVVTKGLVNDSAISALESALPNTPKAQQYIQAIKNAQTIKELRSAQAPFVNAMQLASEKAAEAGTAGASNRSLARQGVEVLAGLGGAAAAPFTGGASALIPAGELALATDTGKNMTGNALRWVSGKLVDNTGKELTSGTDILNTLPKVAATRYITQAGPRAIAGIGSVQNHSDVPNSVDSAINTAMASNPQMASVATTGTPTGSTQATPDWNTLVSQLGLRGAEDYMSYQHMTQPQLSQEQQTNWTQGQTLLSRLKQVAQLYSESNAGPIKGRLSELSAPFGTASGKAGLTYDAQRDELSNTLVRFINEGGRSGGAQLTTMLRKELPTLGDSPQTAALKFQTIVNAVVMQMQNNLAAPATNVPGALRSFAGQQAPGGSAGNLDTVTNNILNFLPSGTLPTGAF